MKKESSTYVIPVSLIFIVIFNILFFTTCGFHHPASVWISYGFIHFALLMIIATSFFNEEKNSEKALRGSLCYFFIELIVGSTFILMRSESYKVSFIVQIIIFGIYALILFYRSGNAFLNYLLFLAVFSTSFFVLGGFKHPASVWISYGFISLSYLITLATPCIVEKDSKAQLLGYSPKAVSIVFFFIEFIVGLIFILVRSESYKASFVVQTIILALYVLILISSLIDCDDENKIKYILLDFFVVLVAFNLIFFGLSGFKHPASVWISYGFIHFAYLLMMVTSSFVDDESESNGFVIGIYFIIEFIVGLIFIFIRSGSYKVSFVIQIIIFGLYAIILLTKRMVQERSAGYLLLDYLVFLAVFSAVFFVLGGFHHTTSAWISYGCVCFAYLITLILFLNIYDDSNEIALVITISYFVTSFIAGLVFMIVQKELNMGPLSIQLTILGLHSLGFLGNRLAHKE